jgi:hypothetical protein
VSTLLHDRLHAKICRVYTNKSGLCLV